MLHVYGLILLSNLPYHDAVWANTGAQVILILAIAVVLNWKKRLAVRPLPAPQVVPVRAWVIS